ncbi:unnamed protein product [Cylindrotheca closterium]|uniref:Uncharacterized protein n=1 Tax=Cylindrotheca closterium TaxID=2856 RepID=A0AAD2CW05_9STRA|nr:unnamed protein product [Cylindrotheca closterium]
MKRRRCGDMPLNGEIFGHRNSNQQTTSKRRIVKSQPHTSWFSILSLLYFSVNVGAHQSSLDLECYELLQQTRRGQEFELGTSDYAFIVSRMSDGKLEPLFDHLPGNLHEDFRIKAKQPCRNHKDWGYCIDLRSSLNDMPTFCRELRSELEASKMEAPSPLILPNAPSIHLSTNNKRQYSDSRGNYPDEVSPPSASFQVIHQERRLQSFIDCKINISIADEDRSNRMKKTEFVVFLNRMSSNQFSGNDFTELPQRFQSYFEDNKGTGGIDVSGARPGQTPTTAENDSLTQFCDETKNLIAASAPVGPPTDGGGGGGPTSPPAVDCDGTIAQQQCFIALAISDRNRDDLLQEDDYIRFVNRLSSNEYVDATQLEQLPSNIRSNFRNLENNGAISISGSKPGQSASTEEEDFLSRVCCETDLAVQDPGAISPPSGGPFPTTAPVQQCVSSISRQQCNIFLSIADLSKDNFLNQVEYIRFLDRLSTAGEFSGVSFANLPAPFIANYEKFATVENQIDVFGTKPGQTAGAPQNEFVDQLCCETNQLVEGGAPPPTPVPITPSPTIDQSQEPSNVSSTAPSMGTFDCLQNLQQADLFKDSFLSTTEYVTFVNQISGSAFEGIEFAELPCQLVSAFDRLSNNGGRIPITGATSDTATEEQVQQALNLCAEVSQAIAGQGADECSEPPSMAPDLTEAPTTSPPTAGPIDGEIEIFNAFVILNTRGILAERLGTGTANRNGLDAAYDLFVTESVGRAIASGAELTSSLRGRRRLDVALQAESASIYNIVDSECPVTVTEEDATCQVGYGRFRVDVTNEYAIQIVEQYTNFTQNDILNGLLQSSLVAVDPNSVLQIVDAFFPVRDPNEPTNPPATNSPQSPLGPADDQSSNTGAIVGGVLGGLLLCVLCVGIGTYTSTKKGGDKAPKLTTTGGDDDNSVIGGDDGNIVRPLSSRENVGNIFDNIKNRFGGNNNIEDADAEDILEKDEDDDSDQEDNEFGAYGADFKIAAEEAEVKAKEKEKKNVFGFGKKDKKGKEPGAFGLQTVYDSDSSSNRENDFGKYGFEDPDALMDDDEEGEDEDDAGSKEKLFESNMSPAWGTSETGFGAGWGAGGSNDIVNDFFGKSFGGVDIMADGAGGKAAKASPVEVPEEGGDENGDEEDSQAESSFESSEDSTYESSKNTEGFPSGTFGDGQNEPDNSSSADHDPDNSSSADSPEEGADEDGDGWATKPEKLPEGKGEDEGDLSDDDDDDETFDQSQLSGSVMSASSRTSTTGERQRRIEYQAQVDALVRIVLPDQTEKVQEMMDQFHGREPELISTLQNMQERSATQRARQAVHRSKKRPDRIETRAGGSYAGNENLMGASEGSAAGTAAIAAASLPIPAGGFDEAIPEDHPGGFGAQDAFGGYPNEEDENSLYSGDHSRDSYDDAPTFADDNDGQGYDDQDRSYDDQDRSYDSQDRSYDSQDRSYDDRDRSYGDDPGQDGDEDSRGSFYSGDDMGDAFGSQDPNAFGSQDANAFGSQDADTFGSQGASAFGSQGASAFGSQDVDAFGNQSADVFGSQDASAFDSNAFGSQGQNAFDPNDAFGSQDQNAFGSDAFGSNAFGDRDQDFGDEEGYSQGSHSQGSYSQDQDDRRRPSDQGFGNEEGYSQGSYSQGSYSQDPGDFAQDGRRKRDEQGFDDDEGYSQGSYSQGPDSFAQDSPRRPDDQGYGDEEGYSQGSYSQGSYSQDPGGLEQDDRRQPIDQGFGDEEGYSQGSYSQGSYSQGPDSFAQDSPRRPDDQGYGDEEGYSQGSYSQDEGQGSYDDRYDGEGQDYGDDDGGSQSYYSGEDEGSFGGEEPPDSFGAPPDSFGGGGNKPDSFGAPPDSFGGGGNKPDSFGAGGWPDE